MTNWISGIHLQYYKVCQRKLWLYSRGITFENENERVFEGKLLHERAYPQLDEKEILIDNTFKIDAIDGEYVREVKLSSQMPEADRMQMLFYLYELKKRGVIKKGLISYTKERETEEIILDEKNEEKIIKAMNEVVQIVENNQIPKLKKLRYCGKCAYYNFCFAVEAGEE